MLILQCNLADTYESFGHLEKALRMERDVYSGYLTLFGEDDEGTLYAANNYALSLCNLERFEEAKSLLRRMMPVARRVLGEGNAITLDMRSNYAEALCRDDGATLNDLREAVTTLEETERTMRRVFGGAHPTTVDIGECLQESRATLRAHETPASSA